MGDKRVETLKILSCHTKECELFLRTPGVFESDLIIFDFYKDHSSC